MEKRTSLIIGASGGIATAIIKRVISQQNSDVIAISRSTTDNIKSNSQKLHWLSSDNTETSILSTVKTINDMGIEIDNIIITNGVLHNDVIKPEKRLEDINADQLRHYYDINTIIPMLWLRHLLLNLSLSGSCSIAVLSARIGSIEDNQIGGWYGYRSSKAALNMLLKTLAIEWQRRHPGVSFLSFHPGTTDTALSAPFQANVAKEKLFTPDFVAEQLLSIMTKSDDATNIQFLDWAGKEVPW